MHSLSSRFICAQFEILLGRICPDESGLTAYHVIFNVTWKTHLIGCIQNLYVTCMKDHNKSKNEKKIPKHKTLEVNPLGDVLSEMY